VHALASTIAALKLHIFNGVIWPDFTQLPSPAQPVLAFSAIEVGQTISAGRHRIEVLPAAHTVPAVGFAVLGPRGAWVYTGDTGPNPALWRRLATLDVAALVIETAFRDDELELARISRHLCPAQLGAELAQLETAADIYITHVKPGEVDAVMTEIGALDTGHRVRALASGQVLSLAD
jgi:ribonuclease BN (tRNA processing enzyme)